MTEDDIIAALKVEIGRQATDRGDHFTDEVVVWGDWDGSGPEPAPLPDIIEFDGRLDLRAIAKAIVLSS